MELYFLRHAIAVEPGLGEYTEEERPLTPEGVKKMTQAALGMKTLGIVPTLLLSSPYIRALETAEIVREQLKIEAKVKIEPTLVPGASLQAFLKKLRKRPEEKLMLVGHEPSMSLWIGHLLGCGPESSVLLKKGALAQLELYWEGTRPLVQLVALLQPQMLRLMS